MSTEKLKEKLAEYELKREEIEANDFAAEIEKELAEYRIALEKKYADKKEEELAKADAYLFLLNELIAESEQEDMVKAELETPIVGVTQESISEVKSVV